MSPADNVKRTAGPASESGERRVARRLVRALALIAIAGIFFLGRGAAGGWARYMASRHLDRNEVSAAQEWLRWAAWFAPGDGRTDLLRAICFRHLNQEQHFVEALESAREKGAPVARIQLEGRLSEIQAGRFDDGGERELLNLLASGASPHDASAAFVFGYLYKQEPAKAKRVLDAWEADFPDEPRVAYTRGVYWRSVQDTEQAEAAFQVALARQPSHEPARLALAVMYLDQDRIDDAREQLLVAATRFPASEMAHVNLARLLRKSGRVDEALRVLVPFVSRDNPPEEALLELSEVEFEAGNYEEAGRRLKQARLDQDSHFKSLLDRAAAFRMDGYAANADPLFLRARAAATTLALGGKAQRAEWLFDQVHDTYSRMRRMHELRVRLSSNPSDSAAADELARLQADSISSRGAAPAGPLADGSPESVDASGPELYALHCAACHGPNGDGNGRAARHLHPRPRDYRADRFRLVSASNAVPTVDDLASVVRRGMPGTSMPAFDELSEHQRRLLAEEVIRLHRQGVADRLSASFQDEGQEVDEHGLREFVLRLTTPADVVPIPGMGAADPLSIARGGELYVQLGCRNCHEPRRGGSADLSFFDERGRPAPARNLVDDPFKGGHEPGSVYLRVRLGMPGTAHPACSTVSEEQLIDLVHFCRSLSREPKRALTNHERSMEK